MLLHVRRLSSAYSPLFSRGVSCFGATSPSSLFVDRLSIVDHLALFRAPNRDGDVDQDDRDILDAYHGLTQCASKFHGDADGDGDVDDDDIDIWELEDGSSY